MAFSFGGSGGGSSRRFRGNYAAMAEMNVVPLVDVVLVLLIVFMLTAHVMEFGMEINVPKVAMVQDSAEDLPVISISRTAKIQLNETPINYNSIAAEIRKRFPNAKAVYVRADKEVKYEPVAQVVYALGKAGLSPRLVTQPNE